MIKIHISNSVQGVPWKAIFQECICVGYELSKAFLSELNQQQNINKQNYTRNADVLQTSATKCEENALLYFFMQLLKTVCNYNLM